MASDCINTDVTAVSVWTGLAGKPFVLFRAWDFPKLDIQEVNRQILFSNLQTYLSVRTPSICYMSRKYTTGRSTHLLWWYYTLKR